MSSRNCGCTSRPERGCSTSRSRTQRSATMRPRSLEVSSGTTHCLPGEHGDLSYIDARPSAPGLHEFPHLVPQLRDLVGSGVGDRGVAPREYLDDVMLVRSSALQNDVR